jgi:hypothetical protein
MGRSVVALIALAPGLVLAWFRPPAPRTKDVEIEAAVPISEPGRALVEPFIAADPTDANRLLVTASQADSLHGMAGRAFTSDDGGRRWKASDPAAVRIAVNTGRLNGIQDMWASIGDQGTMYVSMLALHAPGALRNTDPWSPVPTLVVRSTNHGKEWSEPAVIRSRSSDAPKIAVWRDSIVVLTTQLDAGDTVAGVPRDGSEYVAVYRSVDRGRTFAPPRFLAFDDLGRNPISPVFLADGTLLVAWFDHPHYGRNGPDQHVSGSRIAVARSSNGGLTFDLPHVVADVQRAGFPAVLRMIVDHSPTSAYHGRVYVVWNGGVGGHSDVSLASSDDGGLHWTAARHVTSGAGADVFTAAATNRDGVVALAWAHHASDASTTPCYLINLAASTDGGDTFSAPHALTADEICPDAPANRAITYPFYGRIDTVSRWRHGGDYIGLAASGDAVFHPVWTDTRDGSFRVYTARVHVRP